jgi:WD40 repeat protein
MVDSEPNVSEKLTFSQLPELYGHSRKVYALAFNKDGSYLASGCVDKSIRVWSIEKVGPPAI